ncbi:23S rRNA (uracil(1939)-C(5))-methyltransferase RlmD [Candidatus Korobacter versatilis]|uniref:23S rRNA (uracil(1939)-C(5))-methyltransferase RlmD n=1 Tax=Candidatus Korobacter versatilis TaxID=658062 RepID=UPI0002E72BA8|nr:23S rRNA (uracil(1939)-C(5))-methyltransferase RlmD [Candidatus Koribacter versatilis]
MELKIEKLIYGGDGLARMHDAKLGRSKAVFLPFVAPGETVEAIIREQKPGFARAQAEKVLQPSEFRQTPPCPYFFKCGGCQYQHLQYAEQVKAKAQILEETLSRTAKLKLEQPIQTHAAEPLGYRNRTRMRVSHVPQFAIGYYRFGSHSLLPVEQCPISSPLINRVLQGLWAAGREERIAREVREVQFFANHDDSRLLLELYIDHHAEPDALQPMIETLRGKMPEIAGVAVFRGAPADDSEDQRAPLTRAKASPGVFFGERSLRYKTKRHEYQVSAGAFFQTNRFLLDEMAETVTRGHSGKLALDLYSGGGFFSLPLADQFEKVIAVEASGHSQADLKTNALRNVKAVRSGTEEFLRGEGRQLRPDLVVVDPPRAGLGEKTSHLIGRMSVGRVTYVSCDPATLSRDMKVLVESGFRVEEVHLFDLFPQTYHLESVLHLVR